MTQVRDTIHVNVEYFDGQEEGDVGYPYFVASCEEIAATTDAITLDELFKDIREMIELMLEDPATVAASNLAPNPHIIIKVTTPLPKGSGFSGYAAELVPVR